MKGFLNKCIQVLLLVAVCLSFVRCSKKEQKSATKLLTRDEMVQTLAQLYIAEEKVNNLLLPKDSAEAIFKIMEGKVYEKTGVPDSVFAYSFDYYMDRPRQMEEIYTALVDTLQLWQQRAPFTLPAQ